MDTNIKLTRRQLEQREAIIARVELTGSFPRADTNERQEAITFKLALLLKADAGLAAAGVITETKVEENYQSAIDREIAGYPAFGDPRPDFPNQGFLYNQKTKQHEFQPDKHFNLSTAGKTLLTDMAAGKNPLPDMAAGVVSYLKNNPLLVDLGDGENPVVITYGAQTSEDGKLVPAVFLEESFIKNGENLQFMLNFAQNTTGGAAFGSFSAGGYEELRARLFVGLPRLEKDEYGYPIYKLPITVYANAAIGGYGSAPGFAAYGEEGALTGFTITLVWNDTTGQWEHSPNPVDLYFFHDAYVNFGGDTGVYTATTAGPGTGVTHGGLQSIRKGLTTSNPRGGELQFNSLSSSTTQIIGEPGITSKGSVTVDPIKVIASTYHARHWGWSGASPSFNSAVAAIVSGEVIGGGILAAILGGLVAFFTEQPKWAAEAATFGANIGGQVGADAAAAARQSTADFYYDYGLFLTDVGFKISGGYNSGLDTIGGNLFVGFRHSKSEYLHDFSKFLPDPELQPNPLDYPDNHI